MKDKPDPATYAIARVVELSDAGTPPQSDWGRCHSCDCKGFTPTGKKNNICNTCSHHWSRHW
jgi:hypothetical protein